MKTGLPLNKKIFILSIAFLAVISFSSDSFAYSFAENSGISEIAGGAGYNSPTDPEVYIGTILTLLFSFVGMIFMILTIYAGIQWMTAQGNTSQVSKAKDTLIKAIVGLVIIMAAYGITYLVVNTFQSPPPVINNGIIGK